MIIWTVCFKYGTDLRGFDLTEPEKILSFSDERYFDTATGRNVVVGKHRLTAGPDTLREDRRRYCACDDTRNDAAADKRQVEKCEI